MNLQEQIRSLVEKQIEGTEIYLVEVRVSPAKIVVTLDHPKNLPLDECVKISRYLHEQLDESDVFERHELEVGSPGMEEPLKVLQQYRKRINQRVSVITFDGLKRSGILKDADSDGLVLDEEFTVREGSKKSIAHREVRLPFEQIKDTRVIFSFDKIIK
jgi:ribosome maturation factor RimP